jgi:AraC-like DNA-binding protein
MKQKIDPKAFAVAWQAAGSLDELLRTTGLSYAYATSLATWLRKQGTPLKKFSVLAQLPESRSVRAARDAREEGMTFTEAAAHHGISHQAVQQTYARLFPGEPPPVGRPGMNAFERAMTVELSAAGASTQEVVDQVGFSSEYVGQLRRRAGIRVADGKRAVVLRAVESVRAGASIGEAAADHGLSSNHVGRVCRELGVVSRGWRGRIRNGRCVAAADLVESEGMTVGDAARATRCTPAGIYGVLKRRESKKQGTP